MGEHTMFFNEDGIADDASDATTPVEATEETSTEATEEAPQEEAQAEM